MAYARPKRKTPLGVFGLTLCAERVLGHELLKPLCV